MPLKIQQDGSQVGGQPNTVLAAWWNDYHDLLTGVMTDQDVTLSTDLILKPMGAIPTAPTAVAQAGAGLGIGAYQYLIVFAKAGQAGYSGLGASASVTTTSGNQAVGLSNIAIGPAGTSGRLIYRTKVGGSTFYYVATISDNTTTTYVDTAADTSLTVPPNAASFGGTLLVSDSTGTTQAILFNDGHMESFVPGATLVNTQKSVWQWRGTAGTDFVGVFDINPSDAGQKHWMIAYNGGDQHLQIQQVTDNIDVVDFDTSGNAFFTHDIHATNNVYAVTVSASGSVTSSGGMSAGSTIFQQGSSIALTGSHSAAQIALSYGGGPPSTLGSNEIYFQIS